MRLPEIAAVRALAERIVQSGLLPGSFALKYAQCRLDQDFASYVCDSILYAMVAFAIAAAAFGLWLCVQALSGGSPPWPEIACPVAGGLIAAAAVVYLRAYAVSSLKAFRGALIDANVVHVVGLMRAMAGYDVPLKRMLVNLSNLGDVYGEDVALEAAYALSLIEEDGMDVISALRVAQSTSPSAEWQELLIGVAAVYNSGGSLRDYLQGRYAALADRKTLEVRRYNEKVQGTSSIYLSVIGIAAIFIAIINLVFNMAGMLSGDALVWIDALAVVPLGSFIAVKALHAAYPEASP